MRRQRLLPSWLELFAGRKSRAKPPTEPFFDPEAKLDKMLLKYAHDILDKTPEEVKLRTMGPSGA